MPPKESSVGVSLLARTEPAVAGDRNWWLLSLGLHPARAGFDLLLVWTMGRCDNGICAVERQLTSERARRTWNNVLFGLGSRD